MLEKEQMSSWSSEPETEPIHTQYREISYLDTENLVNLMHEADEKDEDWARARIEKALNPEKDLSIIVAEQDGYLIGYVGVMECVHDVQTATILGKQIENLAHLTWVAVHPAYRGQGVGKGLISSVEEWARLNGRKGVWLDCRKALIPVYAKLGYTNAGNYIDKEKLRYVFVKIIED